MVIEKERLDKHIQDLEKGLWYDIKKPKSDFLPSHTKLKGADGSICASNERPHILADHFEHKQWSIDENRERETPAPKLSAWLSASGRTWLGNGTTVETGLITVEQIRASLRKMRNNRSPGPDGILVELLKLMDDGGLELIGDILNNCWEDANMPDEMEFVELVTLYKRAT